jgi:hypothetical protein
VPAPAKLALAALLALSIHRAFLGAPPAEPHSFAGRVVGGLGGGAYAAGVWFALLGPATAAAALVGAGTGALCLAVWLSRWRDDEGGGGGGDDGDDGPPVDWGDFDRRRALWEHRPRVPG